jgi:hypothetical protein
MLAHSPIKQLSESERLAFALQSTAYNVISTKRREHYAQARARDMGFAEKRGLVQRIRAGVCASRGLNSRAVQSSRKVR